MSIPSLAPISTSSTPAVRFEESAGGTVVPLSFHSVAALLDVTAGHSPARLPTLLTIIWQSSYKSEIRAVLQIGDPFTAAESPVSFPGAASRRPSRLLPGFPRRCLCVPVAQWAPPGICPGAMHGG